MLHQNSLFCKTVGLAYFESLIRILPDPAEDKDDAEASADTEALEEVEEEVEAALADSGETDEVQSARASASEWLRDHVLKSTAGLTEK